MRRTNVFSWILVIIMCITSCATGGFTTQEVTIEPIEETIDASLTEASISDAANELDQKDNTEVEAKFEKKEKDYPISSSNIFETESISFATSNTSISGDDNKTLDDQELTLVDEVQPESESPKKEAPTFDSQTSTESKTDNGVRKIPTAVGKRYKVLSAVSGITSIVFLIIAIMMHRKERRIRKISFLFFAACIIFAILSFAFYDHDFCKHEWVEATCVYPKQCVICGKEDGKALGHDFIFKETIKESTCSEEGIDLYVCSRCKEEKNEESIKKEHVPGTIEITRQATYNYPGTKAYYCMNCNMLYKTETYELSESEKEEAFKDSCYRYSYDMLARNPDRFAGSKVKLAGKVTQVMEDKDGIQYQVYITQTNSFGTYSYDDPIFVIDNRTAGSSRILENDIVAIYGVMHGNCTVTTVLGVNKTVPLVSANYIDRIRDRQYDTI